MLKTAGCICILAASAGMSYSFVKILRESLRQLEALLELVIAAENEVAYCRYPLPELFTDLSAHMEEPFRAILTETGALLETYTKADIPVLWQEVCDRHRKELALDGAEYQILLKTGEAFGYTSLEASLQILRLNQHKLSGMLEQKRQETIKRQKLYCCMCYMTGLFVLVVFL